jgi:hypothetical protein
MKILAYSPELQKQLKSKVEPAPWLHAGIMKDGNFGIWVWDSRDLLEHGHLKNPEDITGKPVNDNREALKGSGADKLDLTIEKMSFNDLRTAIKNGDKEIGSRLCIRVDGWSQYAAGITGQDRWAYIITGPSGTGFKNKKDMAGLLNEAKKKESAMSKRNSKINAKDSWGVGTRFEKHDVTTIADALAYRQHGASVKGSYEGIPR